MSRYVLGIDQSTQGTKGLLFDENGALICRSDLPHRQYIDQRGWVEHDPEEIYANTVQVVKKLVEKSGIDKNDKFLVKFLVSAISGKLPLCGTGIPESLYIMQLCGSVPEAQRSVKELQNRDMEK